METFLLLGVIVLAILAVGDLMVGVGNDAVNFLNSAIGSRVAKFRTIMWVASIGVFIGALSSAGMMEIAREGIFNPELFTLEEVMIIFLAVMLTDIILLDAFNTLGLPTSTTVSIIFELLGAAIVVASFKILANGEPMNWLFNTHSPEDGVTGYLNWKKTSTIVSSIVLSILLAFGTGVVVMFFSRLLFSFQYTKRMKVVGVIWASLAMLAMSYYLVFKGLKSTYSKEELTKTELISYIKSTNPNAEITGDFGEIVNVKALDGTNMEFKKSTDKEGNEVYAIFFGIKEIKEISNFIQDNSTVFIFGLFLFWVLLFAVLQALKISILKIVVFAGTFSMAMAFAGNDLVNFIGVPLAGWQSYGLYQAALSTGASISPSEYNMIGLKFPIQAPHIYLFIAGLVMVLTLWFSKKTKTVIDTEVSLGHQEETDEKFKSNMLSRWLVQGSVGMSKFLGRVLPDGIKNSIEKQFTPLEHKEEEDAPAFDLIRASVNLTIASMLIALATSYKLPLSTTYVSFMVAMGTSLADRAWGRESASYRIAGVLNVVLGWIITAFIALSVAGILAVILLKFKLAGLIALLILLAIIILFSNNYHKKILDKKVSSQKALKAIDLSTDKALQKTGNEISKSLEQIIDIYQLTLKGLLQENIGHIQQAKKQNAQLNLFYGDIRNNLFKAIKKSKLSEKQTAQLYILGNDIMQDILQSLSTITDSADTHVKNAHKPLRESQRESIIEIEKSVLAYMEIIKNDLLDKEHNLSDETRITKRAIFDQIESALSNQVEGIMRKEYGFKNTNIILSLLLETKDLIAISIRFAKLLHRLKKGESPLGNRVAE